MAGEGNNSIELSNANGSAPVSVVAARSRGAVGPAEPGNARFGRKFGEVQKRESGGSSFAWREGRGERATDSRVLHRSFQTEEEELPPYDLDEYVDWATHKICYNNRMGNYQLKALLCLTAIWFLTSMQVYGFSFITVEPDVDQISGRRLKLNQGVDTCNASEIEMYGAQCPELAFDSCGPENDTHRPEYRQLWEYRDPQNSAKAEFEMSFCSDERFFVTRINVDFWLGYGFGVVTGGLLSDSFGRRDSFYAYLSFLIATAAAMAFASNAWMLGIARVLNGVGNGGAGIIGFVWACESLNPESLHVLAWVPNIYFAIGGCAPAILSLFVFDWHDFSKVMVLFSIPFLFAPMRCFQSPKWLAYTKNREGVAEVMKGIVAANDEPELPPPPSKDDPRIAAMLDSLPDPVHEDCRALCHRKVFPRLIMSCFLWFTISYSYYGLSLAQPPSVFGSDPVGKVLTWCLSFLIEIPGYMAGSYLMSKPRYGRKFVVCIGMAAGGGLLMLTSIREWAPEALHWVIEALYFPARVIIGSAFAVLYVWTLELFPNSIRATSLGISSFFARLGTSFAPLVGGLELSYGLSVGLPTILIGTCIFFSTLPETRGIGLPRCLDDLDADDS